MCGDRSVQIQYDRICVPEKIGVRLVEKSAEKVRLEGCLVRILQGLLIAVTCARIVDYI